MEMFQTAIHCDYGEMAQKNDKSGDSVKKIAHRYFFFECQYKIQIKNEQNIREEQMYEITDTCQHPWNFRGSRQFPGNSSRTENISIQMTQ